jgi:hypothetical protein
MVLRMARIEDPKHQPAYAAAARFVEQALARQGSLFTPERPVWTPAVLAELDTRHTAADDAAGDSFDDRWARRLRGAATPVVQLAAEIAYVHVLFADDLSAATKRRLVTGTLAHAADPPAIPGDLDAALEFGIAGSGTAFKLRRMSQLGLLIEAGVRWWGLDPPERARALAEPAAFRAFVHAVPHDGAAAQREVLLHLVHPDAFEPIVSAGVKQRIVHAFSRHVPAGAEDVDAALAGIRAALERRHGRGFQFADAKVAEHWR